MDNKNQSYYSCSHENDDCAVVLVASPHLPSVEQCNQDVDTYLYKQPVIPVVLERQHADLVKTLKRFGIQVFDIADHVLSDTPSPLLGNLVFTRDPILCTRKGVVMGRFKEHVRAAETTLMENILPSAFGVPVFARIQGTESVVEGGDFMPAGDTCFLGIGNRTNMQGVQELMERDLLGTKRVVVVKHPKDGNMHAIHLDCYMGLVGRSIAVIWDFAAYHVQIDEYVYEDHDHRYHLTCSGINLATYMESRGWTVLPVPTSCQESYGCNLLYLGNGTVLTQDRFVSDQLSSLGYRSICLPFGELHKMYGGIRCATQVLLREPPI